MPTPIPTPPREPAELLPLKPDAFTILLVLLEGESHGYAIMRRASERVAGGDRLQPGALYRVLKRMLDDGLIEELDRREVSGGDERRRYYGITAFGRRVAAAEAARMESLVAVSRAHRLLGDPRGA